MTLQCQALRVGRKTERSAGKNKLSGLPQGSERPGRNEYGHPARSVGKQMLLHRASALGHGSLGRRELKGNQCSARHKAAEGQEKRKIRISRAKRGDNFGCYIVLSVFGNECLDRWEHSMSGLPQGSGRPGKKENDKNIPREARGIFCLLHCAIGVEK